MFNIPEEIKNLYKQDNTPKNIRITFPNGERADITNSDIVQNTFRFKESLCSQDSLKFGLCESPVLEFETVGVGNIKGCKIKAYFEIFCDESVEGAEYRSDLNHYIYSIPCGVFFVNSCKREADMTHRKVVCYGQQAFDDWALDPLVLKILSGRWYTNTPVYVPIEFLLYSFFPEMIPTNYVEQKKRSFRKLTTFYVTTEEKVYRYTVQIVYHVTNIEATRSKKFRFIKSKYQKSDTILDGLDDLYAYLVSVGVDRWRAQDAVYSDYFKEQLTKVHLEDRIPSSFLKETYNSSGYIVSTVRGTGSTLSLDKYLTEPEGEYYSIARTDFEKDGLIEYTSSSHSQSEFSLSVPVGYSVSRDNEYSIGDIIYIDPNCKNYLSIYEYSADINPSDIPCVTLTRDTSAQFEAYDSGEKILRTEYYCDTEAIQDTLFPNGMQEVFESYYELQGKLGRFDRNGKFEAITINSLFGLYPSETLYPEETLYPADPSGGFITPSTYRSAWYEDEQNKPYGRICVTYINTNDVETFAYYDLVDDYEHGKYALYSITDNFFIKNNKYTSEQIATILQTIAQNVSNIVYMASEIETTAMPWIETGDTLEVITRQDGFQTLVFDRTISGERFLADSISAPSTN